MAQALTPIECSAQPLSISFHPFRNVVAAGLVDGTVEVHDLIAKLSDASSDGKKPNSKKSNDETMGDNDSDDDDDNIDIDDDDDDEADTILSSIYVAKSISDSKSNTKMLAKMDTTDGKKESSSAAAAAAVATGKATQGPSCRCVLFSQPHYPNNSTNNDNNIEANSADNTKNNDNSSLGGEYLFTACNGGSLRCLDSELACQFDNLQNEMDDNTDNDNTISTPTPSSPAILWSIENAHPVGINTMFQLPHSSPCGPLLVTGDDAGAIRLWNIDICAANHGSSRSSSRIGSGTTNGAIGKKKNNNNNNNSSSNSNNPFDNLMKPPEGCVMHWKVNHDYITDFEINPEGNTLFATSADGTLSVFDLKFVNKKGNTRSVILPEINLSSSIEQQQQQQQQQNSNGKKSTWEAQGYTKSDNQEDELLSVALIKNSQKLLVGSQQGILCIFSYNFWGDITDRFPGHPHSIDALLKIDEDTVLTGSSDGLVRAVQLLPNSLLGVLGAHDGFPVEGLGWSAGRKMVGSLSHDEYIRLWDASFLNDDDDVEEEKEEGGGKEENASKNASRPKQQGLGVSTMAGAADNSDDEWDDMDEDDEDMAEEDENGNDNESDSDDSDGGGGGNKPKKRENIFKTANDDFFSDL